MHREGAIAEEGPQALERRCEVVGVGCREGVRGDHTMLAGEISDLAGLR